MVEEAKPKRKYRTKAIKAAEAAEVAEARAEAEVRAREMAAADDEHYLNVFWESAVNLNLSNKLIDAGRHARCPQCGTEHEIHERPIVEGATDRKFLVRYFKHGRTQYYISVFGRKEDAGCPLCLDRSRACAVAEEPCWVEESAAAHLARRAIQASGTGWCITRWAMQCTEQPMITVEVRPYGGAIKYIPVADMLAHVFPDAEYAGRSTRAAVYMYWTHCKVVRLRVFDAETDVMQAVIPVQAAECV